MQDHKPPRQVHNVHLTFVTLISDLIIPSPKGHDTCRASPAKCFKHNLD